MTTLTEWFVRSAVEDAVLFSADGDKMIGVDTAFVFAGVMEVEMIVNLSHEKDISGAMGRDMPAIEAYHPIALGGAIACPFPAIGLRFINAAHQSLKGRQSLPVSHTYQFSDELQ